MTREQLMEHALTLCGASADNPFEEGDTVVLRHTDTGKWFGLIMKLNGRDIVNLKCEPLNAEFLRSIYRGVIPAYHMNKVHWNSVYLDWDVPDDEIKLMIDTSFELTMKKSKRKVGAADGKIG